MIGVTFLGVGAALPSPGKTNCAYLIEVAGATILFDCGPAILQQLASVGRTPGDVTHVYVSHGHGDHALGYPMFRLWWCLNKPGDDEPKPIIVGSSATLAHLRGLWEHSYDDVPSPELPVIELPTDQPHKFKLTPKIRVATWPMQHSQRYPVLGARFEAEGKIVAFTADSARCDNIPILARNADLLVHDSAHALTVAPRREIQSRFHCSAADAGEYAQQAKAKRLALVHISADYKGKHAGLAKEAQATFTGEILVPKPGEKVTV